MALRPRIHVPALALALLATAAAAAPAPPFALTAAELAARVAKTEDGLASGPLPMGDGGPVVILARRTKTGDAEVHEGLNDVFVGQRGHATVLVGGRISGQRPTTPGEYRGGVIEGARTLPLNPGDVVWIPAGTPHQVIVPAKGDLTYLAFKSAK